MRDDPEAGQVRFAVFMLIPDAFVSYQSHVLFAKVALLDLVNGSAFLVLLESDRQLALVFFSDLLAFASRRLALTGAIDLLAAFDVI